MTSRPTSDASAYDRGDDGAAGGGNGAGRFELAGMALKRGVLVIGPTHWAAAIRSEDGGIDVAVRRRWTPRGRMVDRVPVLRGPVKLAQMLAVLPAVRRALPASRFGFESRELLLGTAVGSVLVRGIKVRHGDGPLAEIVGSTTSLAATLVGMRGGQVAHYHGAEHKVIGGYERGIPAADAPKEHPRCGTQLAIPLVVLTAAATQGALLLMPRHPRAARIVGQVLGVGLATELFRAGQRGHASKVTNAASSAGLWLQSVATVAEPTADQLAVGDAALTALLAAEHRVGATPAESSEAVPAVT